METLRFKPTKILLFFWLVGIVIFCIPLGGIVSVALAELNMPTQKLFAVGYFIPMLIMSTFSVLFFNTIRYELDDRYITKACGILWRKRRSIPLEKITNIDVRQGPFERIFGYGKIWIFTPSTGAATPEEKLVGVTNLYEMKEIMVERSEAAKQPQAEHLAQTKSADDIVSLLTDIRDSLHNIETSLAQNGEVAE